MFTRSIFVISRISVCSPSIFLLYFFFFFSSRRRHTRSLCDWSSDVCSSDLVAVQVGVILLEHINQLRARGNEIGYAIVQGSVLRLRPILMTMSVAMLGLVPAAMSHGIGSDSQRPFAIVIVGGLLVNLFVSIFLLPSMYAWFARRGDHLPSAELELAQE